MSDHSLFDEYLELNRIFQYKKKQSTRIDEQKKWGEPEHLNYRSSSIDKILYNYTQQQEERYKFKKGWKKFFVIFFVVLAIIIIGGSCWVCWNAIMYFSEKRVEFLTCIITAAVSCFASIVSILLIIVRYIFPSDEETNFNNLVSIIVQNDTERLKDISNNDKK